MPDHEPLHVRLTPKAVTALAQAMAADAATKTDTVNRALVVYGHLADQHAAGVEVLIRRPGQRPERLHLL